MISVKIISVTDGSRVGNTELKEYESPDHPHA